MLLTNVHRLLEPPHPSAATVRGDYQYFHYSCDGINDSGWGCGYRTLQTLCSWITDQVQSPQVPSVQDIQETLIKCGDKPQAFLLSHDWIGSVEVAMCIDCLYQVPCKILHVTSGGCLVDHLDDLVKHFQHFGSPVMMGGDDDSSSKCILGVCQQSKSLLVLDPHLNKKQATEEDLINGGFIQWKLVESFQGKSFYNLCLPQFKSK
ncbi:ufm1-specific protease 1-like [Argonauta hians]